MLPRRDGGELRARFGLQLTMSFHQIPFPILLLPRLFDLQTIIQLCTKYYTQERFGRNIDIRHERGEIDINDHTGIRVHSPRRISVPRVQRVRHRLIDRRRCTNLADYSTRLRPELGKDLEVDGIR